MAMLEKNFDNGDMIVGQNSEEPRGFKKEDSLTNPSGLMILTNYHINNKSHNIYAMFGISGFEEGYYRKLLQNPIVRVKHMYTLSL
jgi:hypothetical protein